ncbi:MAG: hypothetical protein U0Q12_05265 [Vicinamibacterales bacterium]
MASNASSRTAEVVDHVLLLSPAHCGGRRAAALLRHDAVSNAAERLRCGAMTIGEAFSVMSSLYFRGKLAYARAVVERRGSSAVSYVITPTRGLLSPNASASVALLQEFAATDISADDTRYRAPLERDLAALRARLSPHGRVVLLGSIATGKYVDVLAPALGGRLHYPPAFIGRGDMSRGGLLLRTAEAGLELDYAPLTAVSPRHGRRPPRLDRPPSAEPSP